MKIEKKMQSFYKTYSQRNLLHFEFNKVLCGGKEKVSVTILKIIIMIILLGGNIDQ